MVVYCLGNLGHIGIWNLKFSSEVSVGWVKQITCVQFILENFDTCYQSNNWVEFMPCWQSCTKLHGKLDKLCNTKLRIFELGCN